MLNFKTEDDITQNIPPSVYFTNRTLIILYVCAVNMPSIAVTLTVLITCPSHQEEVSNLTTMPLMVAFYVTFAPPFQN